MSANYNEEIQESVKKGEQPQTQNTDTNEGKILGKEAKILGKTDGIVHAEAEAELKFIETRKNLIRWTKSYILILNVVALILFFISLCPSFQVFFEEPYSRLLMLAAPTSATTILFIFLIRGIFSDRKPKLGKDKLGPVELDH